MLSLDFAKVMTLSSTVKLVVSIVVVAPLTVKLPLIYISPSTSNVASGLDLKIPTRLSVVRMVRASSKPAPVLTLILKS